MNKQIAPKQNIIFVIVIGIAMFIGAQVVYGYVDPNEFADNAELYNLTTKYNAVQ
jgi:hypothetical protein